MIHRAQEKKSLPLYGRGENIREWLFVEDHSSAICAILEHGESGEVYNIAGETELSNIDLLHRILTLLGGGAELKELITYVPDRPGHDFRYAMDGSKIKALGWRPIWTMEEGLKETINADSASHDRSLETSRAHPQRPLV